MHQSAHQSDTAHWHRGPFAALACSQLHCEPRSPNHPKLAWHPQSHADAIERQLAHADNNAVRRAYARGEYWDERVRMMQHWSDYLDQLRDGATILRPNFGNSGS